MSFESNHITHLEALLEECRRAQADPKSPTVWRGALGIPAQLEHRLLAELKAAREKRE